MRRTKNFFHLLTCSFAYSWHYSSYRNIIVNWHGDNYSKFCKIYDEEVGKAVKTYCRRIAAVKSLRSRKRNKKGQLV